MKAADPSLSPIAASPSAPAFVPEPACSHLPSPSLAILGRPVGPLHGLDPAFPLTDDEVSRIKASCGIIDTCAGATSLSPRHPFCPGLSRVGQQRWGVMRFCFFFGGFSLGPASGFPMARNRSFRFLSWNVRGLNDLAKCSTILAFIRNCRCCVVCFQETKLASTSVAKLRSCCGFYLRDFRTLDAVGTRGGLLTAWNPAIFDCLDDWSGSYSLNVTLKRKADGRVFLISNIYGPNCSFLKADFSVELKDISVLAPNVWVALGDFNVLFSLRDKNGVPSNVSEILQFRNVIKDIGLFDLPLLNRSFTWSIGRRNPTLEGLDRAFISNGRLSIFPNSSLRALPRPRSDHSPLVLSAFSFLPSASLFRFESFWLQYPALSGVVSDAWSKVQSASDPMARFSAKLGNA